MARSYAMVAEAKVGAPVVAAARFTSSRPAISQTGWTALPFRLIALVMARRARDVPRRLVVAVTADRLYVLRARFGRVGEEMTSWDRRGVEASAARSPSGGWDIWVQPPGGRDGFELRGDGGRATDEVVAAVTR